MFLSEDIAHEYSPCKTLIQGFTQTACEIQSAQHTSFMKKLRFPCRVRAQVRRHGVRDSRCVSVYQLNITIVSHNSGKLEYLNSKSHF